MDENKRKRDPRLLYCPICGSTTAPFVSKFPNDEAVFELESAARDGQYQVICSFNNGGCGTSGGVRQTEADAINLWNMRAFMPAEPVTEVCDA